MMNLILVKREGMRRRWVEVPLFIQGEGTAGDRGGGRGRKCATLQEQGSGLWRMPGKGS